MGRFIGAVIPAQRPHVTFLKKRELGDGAGEIWEKRILEFLYKRLRIFVLSDFWGLCLSCWEACSQGFVEEVV